MTAEVEHDLVAMRHEKTVSWLVLNRPPVNAVSIPLLEAVLSALDVLEQRAETRCIVITGAGHKAFSAGADLKGNRGDDGGDPNRFRDLGRATVDRIEQHPKPVISAIRGWCIGGGFALAMAADLRIASSTARFRTGDAYIGVVPSWGMSLTRLAHYIGRNRALDMLILGEDLSAKEAFDLGLLTRVVEDELFDAAVAGIAERVGSGAPITFKAIKAGIFAQYANTIAEARAVEGHWASVAAASDDLKEGMAAFRDRRPPVFTGR